MSPSLWLPIVLTWTDSGSKCLPQMDPQLITDYARQRVMGPIQADEALLLHSLVRTAGVRRILELGGLRGFSARVFLDALACQPEHERRLYTVDLVRVVSQNPRVHKTIQKDATLLTAEDIDRAPLDLLFLDCHAYDATRTTVRNLLRGRLLSPNAFVVLHDTGRNRAAKLGWAQDGIHQPVERLVAQWMSNELGWHRISVHDDSRRLGGRHGLTVMQRKQDLRVPCTNWSAFFDVSQSECERVQRSS